MQVELLIKLFNSKAGKLEEWVSHKQAWLFRDVSTWHCTHRHAPHGRRGSKSLWSESTRRPSRRSIPRLPPLPPSCHRQWQRPSRRRDPPSATPRSPCAVACGRRTLLCNRQASPTEQRKRQPSFLDNLLDKFVPGKGASRARAPPPHLPSTS